ncbi:MAG TPA: hypothetical protein VHZ07_18160 [Bryobacteraceae bacterium]|jgi:hypothetical protein|nr:hypothetical protein [Bryobacteraceae bacterium]
MNWVERRANKERAIELEANDIYWQLVRSLEAAVRSFNDRYKDRIKVDLIEPPDAGFCAKKTFATHTRSFVCRLEKNHIKIDSRGGASIPMAAHIFGIDADESGMVFLCQGIDGPKISIEQASQAILEQFLFDQDI